MPSRYKIMVTGQLEDKESMVSLVCTSCLLDRVDGMPQYNQQYEQYEDSNQPIFTPQFVAHPQASAFPATVFPLSVARWPPLSPIILLRYYHQFYYQSPVTLFNPTYFQHYASSHLNNMLPFVPRLFVKYPPQILVPIIPLAWPNHVFSNSVLNKDEVFLGDIPQSIETNDITTSKEVIVPKYDTEQPMQDLQQTVEEVPTITEDFEDFDDQTQQSDIFQYLVNKDSYMSDKLFKFRNENLANRNITTLVFQPVARAIAGENGKAIANPLSRAIIQKGANTDIHYEPEAVAVAGPGGIAHAQSDLEISYLDDVED